MIIFIIIVEQYSVEKFCYFSGKNVDLHFPSTNSTVNRELKLQVFIRLVQPKLLYLKKSSRAKQQNSAIFSFSSFTRVWVKCNLAYGTGYIEMFSV